MKSKITIWIPVILIKVYQYILSPMKDCFFGPTVSCRFHPSCSNYSLSAFQEHGLLKGTYLTIKRLTKCHPAHPGGLDPVPTNKK